MARDRRSAPLGIWRRAAIRAVVFLVLPAGAGWAGERLLIEAGDSPVLGAADAPVTVVEFVDYQ